MDKKEKTEVKKAVVAQTPEKPEDKARESEQKQLKSQLKKVEESIEKLELDIKECDKNLSDPNQYQKLMNDSTFFNRYNKLK